MLKCISLRRLALYCGLIYLGASSVHAAPSCRAQSADRTVALVELYTSEGCNSCPPADRWLSRLPANGFSAERIVPLAFHVDFWDYLGWRDRFASAAFSDRQREQVDRKRARLAYTPQVFLDGRDFRAWRDQGHLRKQVDRINARPSSLRFNLGAEIRREGHLDVDLRASGATPEQASTTRVYLALYENGLDSRVTAGENKNVHLHHDYVVRNLIGPLALAPDGTLEAQPELALPPDLNLSRAGLVAFAESDATNGLRQALALPLENCAAAKSLGR